MLLADTDINYGAFFRAMLVILALVVVAWVAVSMIRKRLKEDDTLGTGFTLADLRELHRTGKMTTEEFEKAKAMLVASLAKPPKPTTDVKPRGDALR
jgi:hypothetical protein